MAQCGWVLLPTCSQADLARLAVRHAPTWPLPPGRIWWPLPRNRPWMELLWFWVSHVLSGPGTEAFGAVAAGSGCAGAADLRLARGVNPVWSCAGASQESVRP